MIFGLCPLLGGIPMIEWLMRLLTGKALSQCGTGNIGVSAAFYHGGLWVGLLAVTSEALKGISAVLLARYFFPFHGVWELIALFMLVLGRYGLGRGAGTTNLVWGYVVYDPVVALLTVLLSGISFTVLREKEQGRLAVLVIFPLLTLLRHSYQPGQCLMAIAIATLIGWIYQQMPDDLDLSPDHSQPQTQKMFSFFRGDRTVVSLEQLLPFTKVGHKAATLSQLKQWGYPVPAGWVLPPGDDPEPLLQFLMAQVKPPFVVRSSAVGEDSPTASAAGVYDSVLQVRSRPDLERAIAQVLASYDRPSAIQYRHDRGLAESDMAVLIQRQVKGVFSGVAFSRDPILRYGDAVVIEALPGTADKIVSGRVTPETYRVYLRDADVSPQNSWTIPESLEFPVEGTGDLPPHLLQQVAYLVRHLEARFQGVPQDVEWTYDGHQLWVLQSRPITTLLPIWTRKIAAEVLPGAIRPLTWSINRPLTCGVWGKLFALVLGKRAADLNFEDTATLHQAHAYFNASLLGEIFLRMGLPPESLEFLTRGQKMSRPPLAVTLRNLPGLWRLWQRERQLLRDFDRADQHQFQPILMALKQRELDHRSDQELLEQIHEILNVLESATYFSIMAPLSVALRQALGRTSDAGLDYGMSPEVSAMRALQPLAQQVQAYFAQRQQPLPQPMELEARLHQNSTPGLEGDSEAQALWQAIQAFMQEYGYLSDVGTDIAIPTWREDPQTVYGVLLAPGGDPGAGSSTLAQAKLPKSRASLQKRVNLKGRVTAVYSRLLAELRWSFLALERQAITQGWLAESGDIFFLTLPELEEAIQSQSLATLRHAVENRKAAWPEAAGQPSPPSLVYGKSSPLMVRSNLPTAKIGRLLQGIGASPGWVEGTVVVIHNLQSRTSLPPNTILVVPYTDSGWAPLLAQASGLIAEVGGRLSHGAIVAREYGIPAVMDIAQATQQLRDGQRVRLDGQQGTVEVL